MGILDSGKDIPFNIDLIQGKNPKYRVIHKFGRNDLVGVNYVPICMGGNYRTPLAPVALEILSTSPNDNPASTGAHEVEISGLIDGFIEDTQTVVLNGTTPVPLDNDLIRLFRGAVLTSGTYATQLAGSHEGNITIREVTTGDVWAVIDGVTDFPRGQTQIGAYTIPVGYTGYVTRMHPHVDSGKTANLITFQRQNADDVVTPYSTMRLVNELDGLIGEAPLVFDYPAGGFPEKTDIGVLGKVASGTGSVSVDFEVLLVKN